MSEKVTIRPGINKDIPAILALIKELADYEEALGEVKVTEQQLKEDAFGPASLFEFKVAEVGKELVGMTLYYYGYSTWKGKLLYLDDIVVTRRWRRQGIGTQLFNALIKEAYKNEAQQIRFHVLDWNEPAIKFYQHYGVDFEKEWITCKIEEKAIKQLNNH